MNYNRLKELVDRVIEEENTEKEFDPVEIARQSAKVATAPRTGSAGHPAAHPLLAEIRLCRVQAMAPLKALGIAQNQSAASKAGAALAMKRYHCRTRRAQ
jgi:hypothetical protein